MLHAGKCCLESGTAVPSGRAKLVELLGLSALQLFELCLLSRQALLCHGRPLFLLYVLKGVHSIQGAQVAPLLQTSSTLGTPTPNGPTQAVPWLRVP